VIKLIFLSTIALLAMPKVTLAQTTPVAEVAVVANRTPQPLNKVGDSVTVLDSATVQESQVTQVADLLDQTPGVNVVRNGGEGQQTSVFIRGADADQTLVLVDGVQLNDPSLPAGGFDFANLLTGDISRIEILRGAQSTLWGSQAIGGVVDIITAEPTMMLQGNLDVEGGSRSTQDYRAGVGGTFDRLSFRVAGGYHTTAGISAFDKSFGGRETDGFRNTAFSGRLNYQISPDAQLDLRGYYTKAWNAFDGYDTPTGSFGDDAEYGKTIQYIGYAGLNFGLFEDRLKNRLAVQYTNTDRRLYDPGAGAITETFYGYGANTRFEYQGTFDISEGYRAVFGAQQERSTINSGAPAYGSPALIAHANTDSGYLQVQGEVIHGLTLTGGVRYDDHSTFGGHATGQASAVWALDSANTLLRASFGQGFKAPALYQMFSPYGSETLKLGSLRPEVANSWDIGIERHFWDGHAMVSATYFGRDTRDLIVFKPINVAPFGVYANVGRATSEGLELQGSIRLSPALSLTANYTYTDSKDLTDKHPLLRRPRNIGNASATYLWPFKLTTSVAVRFAGLAADQTFDTTLFTEVPVTLKAYAVVDLRASYPLTDHFELYGRIENLFDQHYETAYQYGTLGRGGFVGLRARF
jgi:vitamin B12 transporter